MDSHYGIYGGQYIPEALMSVLNELEEAYLAAKADPAFQAELDELLTNYIGRQSPLYHAKRLSEYCNGAQIYLKREDLNHTGAHKVNNTIGQALLAKRMNKHKLIAETGAGMHGVATATVAALLGLECKVFMGAVDVARQAPNVDRMKVLGAEVIAVESGSATLKDAMNEAIRYWAENAHDTFYCIGTVAGPHPYPAIVKDFQSVIGKEARIQCLKEHTAASVQRQKTGLRQQHFLADVRCQVCHPYAACRSVCLLINLIAVKAHRFIDTDFLPGTLRSI